MICRQSRDRLALAIRRYVAGRINNDDLDCVEVDWRDRGAASVKKMSWGLYSDLEQHYATGQYAIADDGKRTVARWVVFLHSENEYLWSDYSFIQVFNWPLNLLTLGWWERRKARRFEQYQEAGEFSVWPFVREADFYRAVQRPRFFSGGRQL
jgi:hypothetical protein